MSSIFDVLVSSLVSSLPQIAIAIVGLVLIQTRLKRGHPRAYFYGNIGLVLLLAHGLLGVSTRAYIHVNARNYGNATDFANTLTIANFVGFIVLSLALILILAALVADRSSADSSRVAA
jgi:hypothetical protein